MKHDTIFQSFVNTTVHLRIVYSLKRFYRKETALESISLVLMKPS